MLNIGDKVKIVSGCNNTSYNALNGDVLTVKEINIGSIAGDYLCIVDRNNKEFYLYEKNYYGTEWEKLETDQQLLDKLNECFESREKLIKRGVNLEYSTDNETWVSTQFGTFTDVKYRIKPKKLFNTFFISGNYRVDLSKDGKDLHIGCFKIELTEAKRILRSFIYDDASVCFGKNDKMNFSATKTGIYVSGETKKCVSWDEADKILKAIEEYENASN